jgi:hypothetical protein
VVVTLIVAYGGKRLFLALVYPIEKMLVKIASLDS